MTLPGKEEGGRGRIGRSYSPPTPSKKTLHSAWICMCPLRVARLSLGVSQRKLSAMIGMSRGYYSTVESGHKRSTTKLIRLVARETLEDPVKLMREYEIWRGLKP